MTPRWYQIYNAVANYGTRSVPLHIIVERLKAALLNHVMITDVGWIALAKATGTVYDSWREVYYNGWNDEMKEIVHKLIQSVEPVSFDERDWL